MITSATGKKVNEKGTSPPRGTPITSVMHTSPEKNMLSSYPVTRHAWWAPLYLEFPSTQNSRKYAMCLTQGTTALTPFLPYKNDQIFPSNRKAQGISISHFSHSLTSLRTLVRTRGDDNNPTAVLKRNTCTQTRTQRTDNKEIQ